MNYLNLISCFIILICLNYNLKIIKKIIYYQRHSNSNKIIVIFIRFKNELSEGVCLNSAAALIISNKISKFEDAYEFTKKHLESDIALTHLKKIQTF